MRRSRQRRHRFARRGLSLAESVTAMAVLTVAGSAALSAITAGVHGATEAARMTVAAGLADDLADEAFAAPLRRPADRTAGSGVRAGFDEIDDYAGWDRSPPETPDGRPVGVPHDWTDGLGDREADLGQLRRFRRTVDVEPVEPDGAGWKPAGAGSAYRRVRVTVLFRGAGGDRPLAERTAILERPAD